MSKPIGILTVKGKLTDKEIKDLRKAFEDIYTGPNARPIRLLKNYKSIKL